MRKLAIIDKNPKAHLSQWKAAKEPKKFFHNDNSLVIDIKKYNPNIIFINKGHTFTNIPQAIKDFKSVYFYGDYYIPLPTYVKEFAAICDAVILTNKDPTAKWSLKNTKASIFFASQGTDIEIFKPINTEKKYDIVFGGNYLGSKFPGSTRRLELVRHLIKKNYNLKVVGDGWPKDINALPRQGFIEYNKIINSARITVGISHFIDVPWYTSNRLYQMMATGVPHIAWYSPDVKKLFKNGYIEIETYNELDELIDYFLANKQARNTAGEKQRKEIVNRHTIFHFWQRIENILQLI
jgi:spore maturation protein CgeB